MNKYLWALLTLILILPARSQGETCTLHADQFAFLSEHRPKTVVVLGHGLNNKPEVMFPIARELCAAGAWVYMVRLKGHYGSTPLEDLQHLRAEEWLSDFALVAQRAQQQATRWQLGPLKFVGFSLGSLVAEVYQQQHPTFSSLVHLAPPFATKAIASLSDSGMLKAGWIIPSLNLKAYRAAPGIPVNTYHQLFRLQKELTSTSFTDGVPRLIFLEKHDELVSYRKTIDLLPDLAETRILEIKKEKDAKIRPHHLIIDEYTLGRDSFKSMILLIKQQLEI